jgi:uncharacterized delta-60 repeat protein
MIRRLRAFWVGACALALLSFPVSASAQGKAGRLDPTFGKEGWAMTSLGTAGEEADVQLAPTPNGSAVVANGLEGTIVRFLPDGSQDFRFGNGGELALSPSTAAEGRAGRAFSSRALALDHRGRVLIFGAQTDTSQVFSEGGFTGEIPASSAVVLRFSAEGKPDPSFGEGKGFIRNDFGLGSGLNTAIPMVGAMAGQVDSLDRPVLVAGVSAATRGCYGHGGVGSRPRAVVRLTDGGQPDPTFGGGDGISPIEGSTSFPGLEIDGDDRPVIGAGPRAECQAGTTIYRLRDNGERMAGFGSDGVQVFRRLHLALVETSGGMILSNRHDRTLSLVRLGPDGRRDMSFGQGGVARVHLPLNVGFHMQPAAVDKHHRILLAGFVGSPVSEPAPGQPKHSSLVVARLHAGGRLDLNFGRRGWTFTRVARRLEATSARASLDPQGRLLVGATVTAAHHRDGGFLLARYFDES